MYLKDYIQNLVKKGQVVLRKTSSNFDIQMTLTLNTHLLSSTNLPMFRSQSAIVSKNPLFSLFPIEKSKFQNLTLP